MLTTGEQHPWAAHELSFGETAYWAQQETGDDVFFADASAVDRAASRPVVIVAVNGGDDEATARALPAALARAGTLLVVCGDPQRITAVLGRAPASDRRPVALSRPTDHSSAGPYRARRAQVGRHGRFGRFGCGGRRLRVVRVLCAVCCVPPVRSARGGRRNGSTAPLAVLGVIRPNSAGPSPSGTGSESELGRRPPRPSPSTCQPLGSA